MEGRCNLGAGIERNRGCVRVRDASVPIFFMRRRVCVRREEIAGLCRSQREDIIAIMKSWEILVILAGEEGGEPAISFDGEKERLDTGGGGVPS